MYSLHIDKSEQTEEKLKKKDTAISGKSTQSTIKG